MDYGDVKGIQKSLGGVAKFSDSNAKSDLEWAIHRAAQTPGPAAYGKIGHMGVVGSTLASGGGRFSTANPKSALDWAILKGKQMPGPGQYGRADAPRPSTGVRFNEGNAKSDIEWKMHRAAQTPGPGDYQVPSTLDVSPKKVGGGLDRTVLAEHFGGLAEDGSPSPSKKKKKRRKKKKKTGHSCSSCPVLSCCC